MKPENKSATTNSETIGHIYSLEHRPMLGPNTADERLSNSPESSSEAEVASMTAESAIVTVAMPMPAPRDDASSSSPVADNGLIASDTDNIEKAWIEKAKRIIDDTKGNPSERNDRVSVLRVDYKAKRYGKQNNVQQ
jgi:hypothetical protein